MVSSLKQYIRSDLIPEYIDVSLIRHSKLNARTIYSNLDALMASIRSNGLLQPIIVRPMHTSFETVAGNRRLEACRRLHWVRIPCLVRELSDREAYEVGLVENIERETLTPLEEARAFQRYVNEKGWGGVKSLAEKIGRSEEYVSHRIALLSLPPLVLDLMASDRISPSAAHELIWLKDAKGQKVVAEAIVERKLSAKQVRGAVVMSKKGLGVKDALYNLDATRSEAKKMKIERLLDKSILTLRICILRLDSIIEELDDQLGSGTMRQLLIQKRLAVHNQIDDLIQFKKNSAVKMELSEIRKNPFRE